MPHNGEGPIPARVMLVGEAWGENEDREGIPFVGQSGQELNRMLHEAGIMRSECFTTNVVNYRPANNDLANWIAFKKKDITPAHVKLKDRWVLPIVVQGYQSLLAEIDAVRPNIIVAFGNLALWALTGETAVTKWRGSLLRGSFDTAAFQDGPNGTPTFPKVIPTYHPAAILYQWSWRAAALNDLRRVKRHMESREIVKPDWKFVIKPSFEQVRSILVWLWYTLEGGVPLWIDFDLETRSGHITCAGLSWTREDAICIPFMCNESREGYWMEEQESWIIYMLYTILTNPRVRVRGQNLLYDAQYTYKHWHFIPRVVQDTMISQHSVFSDQPKALGYIASMYCDYFVYWKDEGKDFIQGGRDELAGWRYNCQDCVYTREAGEVLLSVVKKMGLEQVHAFQQRLFYPVLKAMLRGVRVIPAAKNQLSMEIQEQIDIRMSFLENVLGHKININSSKQMQELFYSDLGQPVIKTRAKKGSPSHVTCDDEALQKIAAREPLLKPLVNAVADIRTLEIFLGNFVLAKLDADGRMRCSYNIGGSESGKSAPKTFRLSSSKSAFDTGTNLQNIPSEKSKSVGRAAARGNISMIGDPYALPNIRSMFGPDPGFTFFDMDLDRSDLQVVVWEVDDRMLKGALRLGADIHLLNAFVLDGREPPALEELVETHPKYPDHRGPYKMKREFAKVFCHATNYVGSARTIAAAVGRPVHEVDRAQKIWFGAHPSIKKWHNEILEQITKRRFVENRFGYRWYIFDRVDNILPEAVAWIPQSTTSNVINFAWEKIDRLVPEVQILLQTHDSLSGQFPSHRKEYCLQRLKEEARIVVPYDDPLVIPVGISTSEISWGDCG